MSILSSITDKVSNGALQAVGNVKKQVGSAFDILDPSNARRMISGLTTGGLASLSQKIPQIGFTGASDAPGAASATEEDWRVRISLADAATILYKENGGNPLMNPLVETNGMIFPYTPTISVSHQASYGTQTLTHSNYGQHFYNNSEVSDITISSDFTVQNAEEGQYLLAVVYFMRACTKMFFGSGANVGNPPPIVFLDGYGSHYFPHIPCVVTNFTHALPPEADYIPIPVTSTTLQDVDFPTPGSNGNYGSVNNLTNETGNNVPSLLQSQPKTGPAQTRRTQQFSSITTTTRVPVVSNISVTLKPMYSRKNLHDNFNMADFAAGKLLGNKTTGTGGFI